MSLLPSRGPDVSTAQEGEMQVVGVDEDVEPLLDALSSDTARAVLNEIYDEPGTPSQIADRLDMSIQKVSYHLDKLEDQDLISVAGTRYSEKGQEMKVFEPPDEPLVLFVGTQERKSSLKTLVKRLLPSIGILALASVAVQRFFGRPGDGGVSLTSSSDSGDAGGLDAGDAEATETGPRGGDGAAGSDGGQEAPEAAADTPEPTAAPAEDDVATEVATQSGDGGGGGVEIAADSPEATGTPTPTDVPTEVYETSTQAAEAAAGSGGLSPGTAFFLGGLLVITVLVGIWAYRTYA